MNTPKPEDSKKETADCYSAGERGAMVWYQQLREKWLEPLLTAMTGLGIKPDHITFTSLCFGLAFCPLFFFYPGLAFLSLLLHTAIDGLDGPLARHQGTASRAGSFTDTMCDQIILVSVTIVMMLHPDQIIGVLPGAIYIFLYTVVVVFAMVRNAMGIPYAWVVRPRFVVYIWMALEFFLFQHGWPSDGWPSDGWPSEGANLWLSGSTNIVVWICNALFLMKLASGFFEIRKNL